jgi:hypothetical protein
LNCGSTSRQRAKSAWLRRQNCGRELWNDRFVTFPKAVDGFQQFSARKMHAVFAAAQILVVDPIKYEARSAFFMPL